MKNDEKKTPMQELLEKLMETRQIVMGSDFKSALDFVCDEIKWDFLKKEEEVIMNAYSQGREDASDFVLTEELKYTSRDYYNEIFIITKKK